MTAELSMIPKYKCNTNKPVIDNVEDINDKDLPSPNMNVLEQLLSNYKLKPISNCTAGYSKIAWQLYRKSINTGFQFNLMIVGCSGLGKSSFLNTLFHTQFPENHKTSGVTENIFKLYENEVELKLKIIEVPKFGDKINNSKCYKKIDDYLEKCFEKQMKMETKINRSKTDHNIDHLVHACLYFIQPRSDKCCLRDLDIEFFQNIHNKVNIIPIIAKADTMTPRELEINKSNLLAELKMYDINYFKFEVPEDSGWRAETNSIKLPDRKFIQTLIDRFPFAVVSGSDTILSEKEPILVRTYPWGKIEIDNLAHSDTSAIRTLILSTHMKELINETHNFVYEYHRLQTLKNVCQDLRISADNQYQPSMYLERYFKCLNVDLTKKINEMEAGFLNLVHEKEIAFKMKSKKLENEYNFLSTQLSQELYEFDKDFTRFIANKTQWDCDNSEFHETYGTLRIDRNGRLKKQISKFKQ